jgi:hypothetical protein
MGHPLRAGWWRSLATQRNESRIMSVSMTPTWSRPRELPAHMLGEMVKRHDVTQIPVGQVRPGMTLAIPSEGGLPPKAFQVEEVGWEHKKAAGEPAMMVLTSEPLAETGKPWVLKYPLGTSVTRAAVRRRPGPATSTAAATPRRPPAWGRSIGRRHTPTGTHPD